MRVKTCRKGASAKPYLAAIACAFQPNSAQQIVSPLQRHSYPNRVSICIKVPSHPTCRSSHPTRRLPIRPLPAGLAAETSMLLPSKP